jgi:hypothetical protein
VAEETFGGVTIRRARVDVQINTEWRNVRLEPWFR